MEIGRKIYGKLNRDLSKELHDENTYYDARNMRSLSDNRQSTGAIATVRGTALKFTIPDVSIAIQVDQEGKPVVVLNYGSGVLRLYGEHYNRVSTAPPQQFQNIRSIGSAVGKNSIFLLATAETGEPSESSMGSIWEYNTAEDTLRLLYFDALNISQKYPVEMYYNYENQNVEKLYWWGDLNFVRHINVRESNLSEKPLDFLDVAPLINPSSPELIQTNAGQGNFKPGIVSWAFSYVNINGVETQISPESNPATVQDASGGKPQDETVAVSFSLQIDNLRSDFDMIRIYRIHYTDKIAEPVITLIKQDQLSSTFYSFVDDGTEFVSSFGLTQYLLLGTEPFKSSTGAVKNNRLILIDNTYEDFLVELDTRAYGFNSSGNIAEVFDNNGVNSLITPSNWNQLPIDHDCINKSIKAETDFNTDGNGFGVDPFYYNFYNYNTSGIRGAEGPYIKITEVNEFSIEKIPQRVPSELGLFTKPSSEGYKKATNFSYQGFKRDETYRIGIVFFNKYGQRSFVSWICDYRIGDHKINPLTNDLGEILEVHLHIELKSSAKSILEAQGVYGYQYVFVERNSSNKTILASGIVGPTIFSIIEGYGDLNNNIPPYMGMLGSVDGNLLKQGSYLPNGDTRAIGTGFLGNELAVFVPTILEFRSIELNEFSPTDGYFKITNAQAVTNHIYRRAYNTSSGNYSTTETWTTGRPYAFADINDDLHVQLDSIFAIKNTLPESISYPLIKPVTIKSSSNILNFQSLDSVVGVLVDKDTGASQSISSRIVRPIHSGKDSDVYTHDVLIFASKSLGDQIQSYIVNYSKLGVDDYLLQADYKRYLPNQYGGNTFADRSRNKYIPCSRFFKINETISSIPSIENVCHGDSFTSIHNYCRSELAFTDITGKSGHRDIYQYISESIIAEPLRMYSAIITRKPGQKLEDYYKYNTAYDRKHNVREFFGKPLVLNTNPNRFNEVKYSDAKSPGETLDSWLTFAQLNVGYLEGSFGKPTRALVGSGDELFIWQENAYGVYAIEPSVTNVDSVGNTVYIGTGQFLHSFTYLSKKSGLQQKWAISSSPYGFIWYDQQRKAIFGLGQDRNRLDVDGITTYVRNLPVFGNNPLSENSVLAGHSAIHNETFLFFVHNNTKEAWVFDHLKKGWSYRADADPSLVIDYYGKMYLQKMQTGQVYAFGEGNPGSMLGVSYPSSVTVIVSDKPGMVKILDNLFWNSEVYLGQNHIHDATFEKIRIWNDHQDTGLIDLNYPDLVRLLREWRYVVPDAERLERFQSQYFYIELYTSNSNNYDLILQSLKYRYRVHPVPFM